MSDRAERCDRCRFFDPDGDHGQCRRNPPVIVPDVNRDAEVGLDYGSWPYVWGIDWCAEFRPLTPPDPPPITKDPGRGMRARVHGHARS